ncbi:MAG: tetratricopeptide repeat protein [Acidobacteria bacterium]|nr:tetratricopeptide repeat protein [Acidobacteriota bacterium]MDW7984974.1 tetratricopeptide repeat protein [Acidobacteriota bacterium]
MRWPVGLFSSIGLLFGLSSSAAHGMPCMTPELRASVAAVYRQAYEGFLDSALTAMRSLADRSPDCPVLQAYWSDLLQWQLLNRWVHEDVRRDVEEAFQMATDRVIRQARTRRPDRVHDPEEAFAYAAAYLLRAQWYGFLERWWSVAEPLRRGKAWLDRAYALDPQHPAVQYYLGSYLYVLDQSSWVFRILRWLLAIPSGDRRQAWNLLRQALQRPSFLQAEIRVVVTGFLQYEGRWLEALDQLRHLRTDYPENPFFHFWEGLFYERIVADYEQAFRIYQAIWERAQSGTDPRYSRWIAFQARYRMGYAAYKQFRFREAEQYFQDVLTMNDKDPPWVIPWTYLALGNLYQDSGQFDKAREAYHRVLQLLPVADSRARASKALKDTRRTPYWEVYPRYVQGRVQLAEGLVAEGCAYFERWRATADDPVVRLGLGECSLARGDTTAALQHFQTAVSLSGGPGMSWAQAKAALYLGLLYEVSAQDKARQYYTQVRAYPQVPRDIAQAAAFRKARLEHVGGAGEAHTAP